MQRAAPASHAASLPCGVLAYFALHVTLLTCLCSSLSVQEAPAIPPAYSCGIILCMACRSCTARVHIWTWPGLLQFRLFSIFCASLSWLAGAAAQPASVFVSGLLQFLLPVSYGIILCMACRSCTARVHIWSLFLDLGSCNSSRLFRASLSPLDWMP